MTTTSRAKATAPILMLAATVVAMAGLGCHGGSRGTRVVLITLDTLRYDSFRGAEGRPSAMPRLLARAQRGVLFDRFFAATSSTQPSHATIFTGLHPWQHGLTRNGLALATGPTTVAETLHAAGFATQAVVAAFPLSARFGFAQGFDRFDEELTEGTLMPAWEGQGDPEERYYRLAGRVTTTAVAQIDTAKGSKQFFWFHYFDAHAPYGDTTEGPRLRPQDILAEAHAGRDVRAEVVRARELYDRDVSSLDASLETLLVRLDRDAGTYDTHVVVVADHGESFGEDGSLAHGKRVTRGQVHVPCVVLSPRVAPAVRTDVAGSIDVAATLLALSGVKGRPPGGHDLLGPVRGGSAFGMRRTFRASQTELRLDGQPHALDENVFYAVDQDGRFYAGNRGGLKPEEGDMPADAAVARRLEAVFGAFERQVAQAGSPAPLDPETERALKALGYLGP
jgi:arylsulfatase A-like enzyme